MDESVRCLAIRYLWWQCCAACGMRRTTVSAAHALRAIGGRTGRLRKDENALHSAVTHDICRDVFTTTHALSLSLLPLSFLPPPALSHFHPSTFSLSSLDVTFRFEFNAGKCTPAKSISCSPSYPPYPPLRPLLPFLPVPTLCSMGSHSHRLPTVRSFSPRKHWRNRSFRSIALGLGM